MKTRSVRRRTVALIAAYAVALQALLTAFVPVDLSILTAPFAVLCSHDDTGASHPAQHDLPCAALCAALGHGVAGPAPPGAVVADAEPLEVAALAPISDWVVPGVTTDGPQAPRGPPPLA